MRCLIGTNKKYQAAKQTKKNREIIFKKIPEYFCYQLCKQKEFRKKLAIRGLDLFLKRGKHIFFDKHTTYYFFYIKLSFDIFKFLFRELYVCSTGKKVDKGFCLWSVPTVTHDEVHWMQYLWSFSHLFFLSILHTMIEKTFDSLIKVSKLFNLCNHYVFFVKKNLFIYKRSYLKYKIGLHMINHENPNAYKW